MPRLLYYFQTLPIQIPMAFLKTVNRVITQFVWASKPPRLAQTILRLPKMKGGIALPEATLYHTACHLTRILDWSRHETLKQWVKIENSMTGVQLDQIPWCQQPLPKQILSHPTVGVTIRAAWRVFRDLSLAPLPSPITPVIGNPAFTPGLRDPRFRELKGTEKSFSHRRPLAK